MSQGSGQAGRQDGRGERSSSEQSSYDPSCCAVVWNPLVDLETAGMPLGGLALVALLSRRWWLPALSTWWRRRARRAGSKHVAPPGGVGAERDLNV